MRRQGDSLEATSLWPALGPRPTPGSWPPSVPVASQVPRASQVSVASNAQSFSSLQVNANQLTFRGSPICQGPSFVTREAEFKPTFTFLVWVKQFHHPETSHLQERRSKRLLHHLEVWAELRHPNILSLIGYFLDDDKSWVIVPSPPRGNLRQYVGQSRPEDTKRFQLAAEVALGVNYLHNWTPPIVHGDLRASNAFLSDEGRAFVGDFGLARLTEDERTGPTTSDGAIRWMSKELLMESARPTTYSDVWAWGCLLLELLTGEDPYSSLKRDAMVKMQICAGVLPAKVESLQVSDTIRRLLSQCCSQNHMDRPRMEDVAVTLIEAVQSSEQGSDCVHESSLRLNGLSYPDPSFSTWGNNGEDVQEISETLSADNEKPVWTGGFADVFKGTWTTPNGKARPVAIKYLRVSSGFIPHTQERGATTARLVEREALIWSCAKHRYIAPLLGFGLGDRPCLVSPWYENGNLSDFLSQNPIATHDKLRLVYQTAEALAYLHSLSPPIAHGDIKPSSVLISDTIEAQLSDFGFSKLLKDSNETVASGSGLLGTRGYQAPELIFDGTCTLETDVFAFGSYLFTVLSGLTPFQNLNGQQIVVALSKGQLPSPQMHPGLTPALWRIVARCWSLDPQQRPTARQIAKELKAKLLTHTPSQWASGSNYVGAVQNGRV